MRAVVGIEDLPQPGIGAERAVQPRHTVQDLAHQRQPAGVSGVYGQPSLAVRLDRAQRLAHRSTVSA
jgi:hypothetical protein